MSDSTKRFSNRVEDYIKFRPHYPDKIIDMLQKTYGLSSNSFVADIGAGVGHSAKLFANHVKYVYGIEPNLEMNTALQRQMIQYINFEARLTKAEETGLDENSVDFIICGQSYHWFDQKKVKIEFKRILKENGLVILIWNTRNTGYPFGEAYEQFLKNHNTDYEKVNHMNLTNDEFDLLFSEWNRDVFLNSQHFNFEGILGRFSSSSYSPAPNTKEHEIASAALKTIFERHKLDDKIELRYDTEVIVGKI